MIASTTRSSFCRPAHQSLVNLADDVDKVRLFRKEYLKEESNADAVADCVELLFASFKSMHAIPPNWNTWKCHEKVSHYQLANRNVTCHRGHVHWMCYRWRRATVRVGPGCAAKIFDPGLFVAVRKFAGTEREISLSSSWRFWQRRDPRRPVFLGFRDSRGRS